MARDELTRKKEIPKASNGPPSLRGARLAFRDFSNNQDLVRGDTFNVLDGYPGAGDTSPNLNLQY